MRLPAPDQRMIPGVIAVGVGVLIVAAIYYGDLLIPHWHKWTRWSEATRFGYIYYRQSKECLSCGKVKSKVRHL